jgi:hypothetical protein
MICCLSAAQRLNKRFKATAAFAFGIIVSGDAPGATLAVGEAPCGRMVLSVETRLVGISLAEPAPGDKGVAGADVPGALLGVVFGVVLGFKKFLMRPM